MAFTKQKINGKWVVTSVGSVNGVEPDDNGNVELELPYVKYEAGGGRKITWDGVIDQTAPVITVDYGEEFGAPFRYTRIGDYNLEDPAEDLIGRHAYIKNSMFGVLEGEINGPSSYSLYLYYPLQLEGENAGAVICVVLDGIGTLPTVFCFKSAGEYAFDWDGDPTISVSEPGTYFVYYALGMEVPSLAEIDVGEQTQPRILQDGEDVTSQLPYIQESEKGEANGVAPLDEYGKVPSERLPEMNYVPTTRKINGETLDHDLTISGLPDVTSADNGKALTVQNGTWAVGSVITYKEV